ncbi:MAG: apolipoprotein N-acyltransferase [Rhizobiaceae bacterium]|nr:apolipoprotein N-acyltransferase [Rhizobiaceae bacterium]
MERLAGNVMLLWGARRWALAFLAGGIAVFALPPFNFFAVLFVSFPILVWLLDGASGEVDAGYLGRLKPAFWTGWWFGFGYFVAGLWWLGNALLIEAEEFAWALPLALLGLPALLALFYGLAAAFARALWSDGLGRICALACGFGLAEWARSFIATGFPWNAIGYGAMPVPMLMQTSLLVGVFGVSALAVFVACIPALIGTRRAMAPGLVVAALLMLFHAGFGYWRLSLATDHQPGQPIVRIVQPSVDQSQKWDDSQRRSVFEKLLSLSSAVDSQASAKPSYIVWPETSIPFLLTSNPDALVLIGEALAPGQTLIAGAVREERDVSGQKTRYYNSIYVIDHEGQILEASDKVHLVPFGEYLPFESLLGSLGMDIIANGPGGFSSGSTRRSVALPAGKRFLPLICYEAIFPQEMTPAAIDADFIINVTNDAWYGNTPGPYQHFQQAQVRAVESGLPLIRAANNGLSAVTDGKGRVLDGLLQNVIGYVDVPLPVKIHVNGSIWTRMHTFWVIIVILLSCALFSRCSFIKATN